jgi:hypothetical protein
MQPKIISWNVRGMNEYEKRYSWVAPLALLIIITFTDQKKKKFEFGYL